jgi:hypothetical protein
LERGVYFDGWFPRQHCYHPSLPPRRLRMVDDLVDYRATTLVWAALGGGSISLPYMEQEAFGAVDPRFRFYGFVNDSEFIAECDRRGIKVFGIVFEVQGWEFPVELNADESAVLAMNELRGGGTRAWLGLREFSQNRYPKLWKPVEHYFPQGLRNSLGEPVSDLLEECCSRDIEGNPCHALWVECPDREHYCYTMDRNNPVWREYLKAVIRIQIDAGVHGVQLDEAELPITSLQYGGCFCRECMTQFREYLKALPEDRRPAELEGHDLAGFHYGEWLRERGFDFKRGRERTPLFWHYLRFQRAAIVRYFAELADYVREYGRSRGRDVQVSGNFFNMFDHYYALEPSVDLLITEMRNTTYRQPDWYRYVAGFAGEKPVIVAENPYGGVVPELIEMLKLGRGYDLYRLSLYEAAALGVNMSVPYGAWMGSEIEDSFTAPHELSREIQDFLAGNERLFSRRTVAEVAVVFSVESAFGEPTASDETADNRMNLQEGEAAPFWKAGQALSALALPYDVLMFPDGELRPDRLGLDDVSRYRTIVLPDCRHLTGAQAALIEAYVAAGGTAVSFGRLGENLDAPTRTRLSGAVSPVPDAAGLAGALAGGPQLTVGNEGEDMAIGLHRLDDGIALHIIRYGYQSQLDAVPPLAELELNIRLPEPLGRCATHSPDGSLTASVEATGGGEHRLHLRGLGVYGIVELR